MNLKKYSSDSFSAMFRNACKKTCFIPIITFAILFFSTISNFIYEKYTRLNVSSGEELEMARNRLGFFWNFIGSSSQAQFISILLVFGGVIAAIVLFSFVLSKKHCNVVFSHGLNRRKIFLANYLGGIVPFYAAIIIAAFCELLSSFSVGFAPTAPLIEIALYFVLSFMGIYTLAFTVTSTAIAFSGNIVESGIFTLIIGFFPYACNIFFGSMSDLFTLGSTGAYSGKWNIFNPFLYMLDFLKDGEYVTDNIENYFMLIANKEPFYKLALTDFSGIITDFVLAGIIFAIAYLMFEKRRNEISGTFGRAKGLNEVCGAISGFYAVTLALYVMKSESLNHGDGNVLTFLIGLLSFVIGYFIFKMIFGHKRKLVIKRMLKSIPAYGVAFAIVTVIFSTGLFGYSSAIPNADEVKEITFSVSTVNPYSVANDYNGIHREADYGYAPMTRLQSRTYYGMSDVLLQRYGDTWSLYPTYTTSVGEEIDKLIEIHKSFVKSGKIRNTASTACGTNFEITYTLKDGSTVKRYYTETTEENAKVILGLSDFAGVKSAVENYFYNPEVEGDKDYASENVATGDYFFLYSKDLKKCHRCDTVTDDLKKAITADLNAQSANDVFFHKPEDELGVIGFGVPSYDIIAEGAYYNEYGELVDEKTAEIIDIQTAMDKKIVQLGTDPDISISLSSMNIQNIVITKDMKNTIKYLTDKGFMKYFNSDITANDVQKIKLATKSESVNKDNSDMLPLFAAGYSTAADVRNSDINFEMAGKDAFNLHYFSKYVNNEITNKSTIQKVLDNSFLYGYCGNDYRVVEVTYVDGSIATYCITGETYANLMK
ncbi:MAG: hypothetical protein ACI4IM_00920 [Acutalibacteraceae bacterium]